MSFIRDRSLSDALLRCWKSLSLPISGLFAPDEPGPFAIIDMEFPLLIIVDRPSVVELSA